jgi:pantoate kinase
MFALKNTDKIATAFAPGNISCFFRVYRHINPRWTGSYGLGFTVNEGVIVSIKQAKTTSISFNSKPIVFPTVRYVIDHLIDTGVSVNITSPLPLGSGFGLSGASALATAYALNNLFKLRKTKKQLAILAHMAEVVNQTGLGDVVNQYFGGFLLKTKPSS